MLTTDTFMSSYVHDSHCVCVCVFKLCISLRTIYVCAVCSMYLMVFERCSGVGVFAKMSHKRKMADKEALKPQTLYAIIYFILMSVCYFRVKISKIAIQSSIVSMPLTQFKLLCRPFLSSSVII